MTSMASGRSWLLDPSLLKLVHQCRRLIHTEFGVKLHLTEDHLERQLASYAGKTRSTQLVRTWETLKPQIPGVEWEDEEGEEAKRVYRGQAIAEPIPAAAQDESGEEVPGPRKKQRIYRGQVVG